MSDKKHDHEKKEKYVEMEEVDKEYVEMPVQNKPNYAHMQHGCPMMHQCPMAHQCPVMGGQRMQQPMWNQPTMQMPNMQGEDMRIKDWFDEWDEFSEDSSFDFDSEDFYLPEKYYKKHFKKHQYPYFWPPYFPYHKK